MTRLLVVDGYDSRGRAALESSGGTRAGRLYAGVLHSLAAGAVLDVFEVGDSCGEVPSDLSRYDGVVWTGSNLTIHRPGALVDLQLGIARAAFAAGVPQFGSCWAIQLAVVAAGGVCARNPNGREFGVARSIHLTEAGRSHPLFEGRSAEFEGFASHEDMVVRLPSGAVQLARNEFCEVQAAEICHERGRFWAVQYHPEYDFHEVASLALLRRDQLVAERRFADDREAMTFAADYEALHDDPRREDLCRRQMVDSTVIDPVQRRIEIRNWLRALESGALRP